MFLLCFILIRHCVTLKIESDNFFRFVLLLLISDLHGREADLWTIPLLRLWRVKCTILHFENVLHYRTHLCNILISGCSSRWNKSQNDCDKDLLFP